MTSPVLWKNGERAWDVCLLDVPRSISAAQGTRERPCYDILLSSEPISSPFPSNEPKSAAARAKLLGNTIEESHHAEYRTILHRALDQVHRHHRGSWCHPRPFVTSTKRQTKKRKFREDGDSNNDQHPPSPAASPGLPAEVSFHVNSSPNREEFHTNHDVDGATDQTYHIPPYSTFSLTDCSSSRSFLGSIRNQAQDGSTRRQFDVMILDPPWPNRSVKRSHKTPGSTYATSTTLDDVFQLVLGTDLDMLMAQGCLVGFWITNKPAVRELVCGDGGMFATWGIDMEEEWIWLKSTMDGEPVSAIESLWRKPYEVLLLGRKRPSGSSAPIRSAVKRKTIISVPDLHSRKPCLKLLLEPMMPDPQHYRALEVFARHLVSGWWSWGNECIRFNGNKHWCSPVETTIHLE